MLAGGAIAEAEMHSWVLFAWSVDGTRAIFAGHVLTLSTLIAIACWLDLDRGTRGAFLAAGVIAGPLTVAFGRWTDRLLRARLQAG